MTEAIPYSPVLDPYNRERNISDNIVTLKRSLFSPGLLFIVCSKQLWIFTYGTNFIDSSFHTAKRQRSTGSDSPMCQETQNKKIKVYNNTTNGNEMEQLKRCHEIQLSHIRSEGRILLDKKSQELEAQTQLNRQIIENFHNISNENKNFAEENKILKKAFTVQENRLNDYCTFFFYNQ